MDADKPAPSVAVVMNFLRTTFTHAEQLKEFHNCGVTVALELAVVRKD
jgi:hypothetical protein